MNWDFLRWLSPQHPIATRDVQVWVGLCVLLSTEEKIFDGEGSTRNVAFFNIWLRTPVIFTNAGWREASSGLARYQHSKRLKIPQLINATGLVFLTSSE